MKSRSRLEILTRSRSRRLRSRLHHWYLQWYIKLVTACLFQAVMKNLKSILLDCLAAKKSGIFDRRRDTLRIVHKQFFYLEGNVNALQTLYRVQYIQE